MDVTFNKKKQKKIFESPDLLFSEYGKEMGKVIMRRMSLLQAAPTLNEVPHTPPSRRHELKGKYKGNFAVDLKHPYRLIFEPNHNPVPKKPDGGIDLKKVSSITILEVKDYH